MYQAKLRMYELFACVGMLIYYIVEASTSFFVLAEKGSKISVIGAYS